MNGHFWTQRLLMGTATVALVAGNAVLVPATAFASPAEHTAAAPSRGCHSSAF